MVKRPNGKLNIYNKFMMMMVTIRTKFQYFYYKHIYLNPYLGVKFLQLYRIVIGILLIYNIIINNYTFVLDLLNILNKNYSELLFMDFTHVKMDPWNNYNPFGEGPSNNVPSGNGPPGNGPGNNPVGLESTIENENAKNRQESEVKLTRKRGIKGLGPEYRYYDHSKHSWVYPEAYHHSEPEIMASKTLRVYVEGSIRYTYYCHDYYPELRYCRITYPDGTYATIYDKSVVMKHIEYHRRHIALGYRMDPPFSYEDYYKEHFDVFRKAKINAFFKR